MTESPPPRGNPSVTSDQSVDHFMQWRSTRPKKEKTPPFLINGARALIDDYPITMVGSPLRTNCGDPQRGEEEKRQRAGLFDHIEQLIAG